MTEAEIRAHGAAEGTVTLAVIGEIDRANADELETKLAELVPSTTGDLRVDCFDLDFISPSGLAVLVKINRELAEDGRALVLSQVQPTMRHVLKITALDQVLDLE